MFKKNVYSKKGYCVILISSGEGEILKLTFLKVFPNLISSTFTSSTLESTRKPTEDLLFTSKDTERWKKEKEGQL